MAWRTRDGRTSDEQQDATRRGTEPRTGIRDRAVERAKTQESMDRVRRTAEALKRGDWHTAWYAD